MVVEQPGGVGVDAVAVDQLLGEARHQLRGRVLARVDGAVGEEPRLRAGNARVGEPDHQQVVARVAAGRDLLPAVADVDHRREGRVRGGESLGGGESLLDRAIAGEARDACLRRFAARGAFAGFELRRFGVADPGSRAPRPPRRRSPGRAGPRRARHRPRSRGSPCRDGSDSGRPRRRPRAAWSRRRTRREPSTDRSRRTDRRAAPGRRAGRPGRPERRAGW